MTPPDMIPGVVTVRPADPAGPAVLRLIAAHVAHSEAHYPAESDHHTTPEAYAGSGVRPFAAGVGCGLCAALCAAAVVADG